jgi:hypothetical protein
MIGRNASDFFAIFAPKSDSFKLTPYALTGDRSTPNWFHVETTRRQRNEVPGMNEIRRLIEDQVAVPLWPDAGTALDLSRGSTYAAAKRGEIKTIRFGRLLKVPTAWLRQKLDLEPTE